jgi:hypothetical protein
MMTAMTSHALLEHAAAANPPPFNGLFYATAATIIPVLFLAIAVQGTTYQDLLNVVLTADLSQSHATPGPWRVIAGIKTNTLLTITLAILGFGVISEAYAIVILYIQKPAAQSGPVVLIGTIFLIAAIAIRPVAAIGRMARADSEPGKTDAS